MGFCWIEANSGFCLLGEFGDPFDERDMEEELV